MPPTDHSSCLLQLTSITPLVHCTPQEILCGGFKTSNNDKKAADAALNPFPYMYVGVVLV